MNELNNREKIGLGLFLTGYIFIVVGIAVALYMLLFTILPLWVSLIITGIFLCILGRVICKFS